MTQIQVSYYSDVLCIWAYVGQRRLDKLAEQFADQIAINSLFVSVFPNALEKIGNGWKNKGGFEGFNQHIRHVAEKFPHVEIHDRVWLDSRPRTSASGHTFVKAVEIIEQMQDGPDAAAKPFLERLSTRAAWDLRYAFFAQARDISHWDVHKEIAEGLGVDIGLLDEVIKSSQALAALSADYEISQKNEVKGSPTYLMNEGRQKLFGNVGYRLIEANVRELLHNPSTEEASWC